MKIKICKKFTTINKLKNRLTQTFPHDEVHIKKCIGMCKVCKHQPAAMVKGKKFKASGISKLITKIKAQR